EVDAVEEHRQLRGLHLHLLPLAVHHRQLEPTFLESLHVEDEPGAVPKQHLRLVLGLADEDEEVSGVRVLLEGALHDRAEPIDALAHVGQLGRQVDADAGRQAQHVASPSNASTRRSVSSSNPARTRTTCPLRSSTSMGSLGHSGPALTTLTGRSTGCGESVALPLPAASKLNLRRHQYSRGAAIPRSLAKTASGTPLLRHCSRTARASISDHRSSMRVLLARRIPGEDHAVTTALAGRLPCRTGPE